MATKLNLKLLVDKKANKVLFAEAGKDFADFLMSLLALPVGSVIRLLTKQNMVGCLGKLYGSVENLSDIYIQPGHNKNLLLNPAMASLPASPNPPLLLQNDKSMATKKYFFCSSNYIHQYVSEVRGTLCPACNAKMTLELVYVFPNTTANTVSNGEGGFVKGVVTYMIMDDLVVTPMSTISSITLLNKFNVKDTGVLEEKVVEVGIKEGLALLKASLQSKTALTDWVVSDKQLNTALDMAKKLLLKKKKKNLNTASDVATEQNLNLITVSVKQLNTPSDMATKLNLKLLLDKKANKVLFAEAGKDFTDFLMSLLAHPVGSVIRLLTKQNMVGCLGKLYGSVENLSDTDIPHDVRGTLCPACEAQMTFELVYASPNTTANTISNGEGGFVKGVVTYMIMDDLGVTPMSTISSITLLNKFNVKDTGVLEEKVVEVGMEEALALLKASLQSKTALTDTELALMALCSLSDVMYYDLNVSKVRLVRDNSKSNAKELCRRLHLPNSENECFLLCISP
ncbi:uncharacterized protein LOC143891880 [Tasmannia lanceolata]|uniref:uncharacterized protein LOC143891880 n=1 Tax=Tasmannia lanceolata TaxID=3420 RepID=UPI004064A65B